MSSARVEKLLQSMTPAEKIGQLIQYFYFRLPERGDPSMVPPGQVEAVEAALAAGRAGSLLFVTDPATSNRLQRQAIAGNRHGIPVLFGFDVIHGLRTIFPVPIALAASWNPELIEQSQAVAAREARAVGIHWAFAPMLDIARDPRWGRIIEGAGEDPYLGSVVAAAQVRGFQGPHLGADEHIIAGPKHFAGYGAALGGRDYDEVDLSDQELWNTYLPPFKAAIDAGAGNVMSAYMDLNGVPATGNRWLLNDILREALGFEGFVVSDANSARDLAAHHYAADLTDAGARALNAGLDLEMAILDPAFEHLDEALENGQVDIERIDTSVRRLLSAKEALGLLDDPFVDEQAAQTVLNDPAHRETARKAAEESAVLLRNENDLLPLTGIGSVAVLGQMANSKRDTLGPWIFDYDLEETVTVLEGIRAHAAGLETPVEVTYAPGVPSPVRLFPSMFDMWGDGSKTDENFDSEAELSRAVEIATAADVAVVVVGERQDMIGETASRSTLDLPGEQLALLQAVVATGTPTVVVLMSGRPLDLRWAEANTPAILQVWYPGTRGGEAVANLLFGQAVPGGKLPFTWLRHVGQVPMHYAHTRSHDPSKQDRRYWDEESTPLYPFGFGLSYAKFAYSNLAVSSSSTPVDGVVTVSVDVTNTSGRDGNEVAQLYLHQRYGTASRPVRLLKGFRRLHLRAGQTERVEFAVTAEERRYWSAATRDWVLDATSFDVWVGGSSTADLHTEFTVTD
ncbi:beta-glucosidase [Kineosporia sp. NBRC 101677]|uniref:glycoside hydrolase family 3 N-terminal domain-containing protein n=1 Tax=Kineosporia sp. NBRC 101677 TaxID=3032197 RepID=UPI0024A084E1|nr:glycoside hydrolase family 3 N-terminal domain-containing protein [Kineosporia sp. NBRC 101677]GLY19595.1 beta-glucosidase [Kineosporia sp. NBRC 101677]